MGIAVSNSDTKNLGEALVETIYAEYGSAIEMYTAACKETNLKLKQGYLKHAADEYRHVQLLFKIIDIESALPNSTIGSLPIFLPRLAFAKGYISKEGRLCEQMNQKRFVEFVYSNELLAKQSFDRLRARLVSSESREILDQIMKDELSHHGLAKAFYTKRYSDKQLTDAFKRERILNRLRMLYSKNIQFLDKIFYPVLAIVAIFSLTTLKLLKPQESWKYNQFDKPAGSIL